MSNGTRKIQRGRGLGAIHLKVASWPKADQLWYRKLLHAHLADGVGRGAAQRRAYRETSDERRQAVRGSS